jgi:hypothetical protein
VVSLKAARGAISALSACKCSFDDLRTHLNQKNFDVSSLLEKITEIEGERSFKLLATGPRVGSESAGFIRSFV